MDMFESSVADFREDLEQGNITQDEFDRIVIQLREEQKEQVLEDAEYVGAAETWEDTARIYAQNTEFWHQKWLEAVNALRPFADAKIRHWTESNEGGNRQITLVFEGEGRPPIEFHKKAKELTGGWS